MVEPAQIQVKLSHIRTLLAAWYSSLNRFGMVERHLTRKALCFAAKRVCGTVSHEFGLVQSTVQPVLWECFTCHHFKALTNYFQTGNHCPEPCRSMHVLHEHMALPTKANR